MVLKNLSEINDNPKLLHGINLSVKLLSKKYPFVIGWKFSDFFAKYETVIFLYLFIDSEKLKSFYSDLEWEDFSSDDSGYLMSFFNVDKSIAIENKNEIENKLDEIYKMIGLTEKDFVAEKESEFTSTKYILTLSVTNFILKK